MPFTLEFTFKFDHSGPAGVPAVALAADINGNHVTETPTDVIMRPQAGSWTWKGTKAFDLPTSAGIGYELTIKGAVGAQWEIMVVRTGDPDRVVSHLSGQLREESLTRWGVCAA